MLDKKLSDRIDFIQRNMSGRDPHGSAVDALPRRASVDEDTTLNSTSGPVQADSFTHDEPTETTDLESELNGLDN